MSVYVDEAVHPFGRMLMCHMMADTGPELRAMATRIGVALKWIQHEGEWHEHFDICKAKRALAIKAGAIEVTARQLVLGARARREARLALIREMSTPALPAVPAPPQSPAAGSAAHVESGAPPARAEDDR